LTTSDWPGTAPGGEWLRDDIGNEPGPDSAPHHPGGVEVAGGVMTVSGNGDIAPLAGESGPGVQLVLIGLVIGLIVVIVVAVLTVSTELRRGLIGVTLLASPRRGRVLAAKAVVLGAVTFAAGATRERARERTISSVPDAARRVDEAAARAGCGPRRPGRLVHRGPAPRRFPSPPPRRLTRCAT